MMGFPFEGFKWEDAISGAMLPVHAFAVEIQNAPGSTRIDLSVLSYTTEIGKKVSLYRPTDEEKKWFRHYRQDDNGLKIISDRITTYE